MLKLLTVFFNADNHIYQLHLFEFGRNLFMLLLDALHYIMGLAIEICGCTLPGLYPVQLT